jgi:hypothetical protein
VLGDGIDLRKSAVRLDVDSTIPNIAATPNDVVVPQRLKQALKALGRNPTMCGNGSQPDQSRRSGAAVTDFGLELAPIGNGRTAALVDPAARIVWWRFPRFDQGYRFEPRFYHLGTMRRAPQLIL